MTNKSEITKSFCDSLGMQVTDCGPHWHAWSYRGVYVFTLCYNADGTVRTIEEWQKPSRVRTCQALRSLIAFRNAAGIMAENNQYR